MITPRRPPSVPNSEITIKMFCLYELLHFHLYLLFGDFNLEIWRLSVFRMCVKNVKVTPP